MSDNARFEEIAAQVLRAGQIVLLIISCLLFLLCPLIEWIYAFPLGLGFYLFLGAMFTVALIRFKPLGTQRRSLAWLGGIFVALAVFHFVPWTSRKPFLKDLYSIKPGMTETDVRRIMGRYMEGTNWPAIYGGSPEGSGTLNDPGSGKQHATESTPDGKLTIKSSLVFRHSTSGAFDSDWGIVALENGRVTGVSFSPD